jgi:hypothetical protein
MQRKKIFPSAAAFETLFESIRIFICEKKLSQNAEERCLYF